MMYILIALLTLVIAYVLYRRYRRYPEPFEVKFRAGKHQPIRDRSYHKLDYWFVFPPSYRYTLPAADQLDINKLFGIKYFYDYSARFGAAYDPETDQVFIFAYMHCEGKGLRKWQLLDTVAIGEPIRLKLEDHDGYYHFYTSRDKNPNKVHVIPKNHNRIRLFLNNAYFGGNQKTPKELSYLVYENRPF